MEFELKSLTEKDSVKTFLGSNRIQDWTFTADIIPVVPTGLLADIVPRLNSRTIGRPFPDGVEPGVAAGPVRPEADEQQPQNRRERRERRNRRDRNNPNRS